jgi:hypothetical protein
MPRQHDKDRKDHHLVLPPRCVPAAHNNTYCTKDFVTFIRDPHIAGSHFAPKLLQMDQGPWQALSLFLAADLALSGQCHTSESLPMQLEGK